MSLVAEEYGQGHLTKPGLRRVLGFETSDQIDGFLRVHYVWIDYTLEDLAREPAGASGSDAAGRRRHQSGSLPGESLLAYPSKPI
jgi:hypothetical protein